MEQSQAARKKRKMNDADSAITPSAGLSAAFWICLILVSFLLRYLVGCIILNDMPLVSDALSYNLLAKSFLREGLSTEPFYWPPGLPLFLSAVYSIAGDQIMVSRLAMIALGTANVVLVVKICRNVSRRPAAWKLSGWIACFYPPAVMMAAQTYSQHLAATCLLSAVLCFFVGYRKNLWWIYTIAFLLLGIGTLTRPSMISVAVAFLLIGAFLFTRGSSKKTLLIGGISGGIVFILIIVPFAMINESLGAGYYISTNNERNFFLGNNKYTPHYKTSHLAQRNREAVELEEEVSEYLVKIEGNGDAIARRNMRNEAIKYIIDHPFVFLWRTMNRFRSFWGFDYIMSRRIQKHYELDRTSLLFLLLSEAGGYALVALTALMGAIFAGHMLARGAFIFLLLVILSYQLPYMLAFSGGAYHFPVMGLVMAVSGAGCSFMLSRKNIKALIKRKVFWLILAIFTAVQLEYLYHAISLVAEHA